jgi:UDP-N-acetyl-alpha-D-quinovosamine dehydrogenase
MKVFVTGANGFIGRALSRRLLCENSIVFGAVRNGKAAQISAGVAAVEIGDINKTSEWSDALSESDIVVHTAARVHTLNDPSRDPLTAYRKVNVQGTEHLARESAKSGVKRFIFISSVKVNGEESWKPYTEADPPSPVDSYGISKLEAELKLRKVAVETGMAVVILRPPLVYGPDVKANFLKLLQTVDRGTPLPFAGVTNQRSLIYVENLVDAIVACVRNPNASNQTYLVSDGEDVSTPELIRMISALLQKRPRLFNVPGLCLHFASRITGKGPTMDRLIGSLTVDTAKITEELGWRPPFTLAEGLEETVAWFRGAGKFNR